MKPRCGDHAGSICWSTFWVRLFHSLGVRSIVCGPRLRLCFPFNRPARTRSNGGRLEREADQIGGETRQDKQGCAQRLQRSIDDGGSALHLGARLRNARSQVNEQPFHVGQSKKRRSHAQGDRRDHAQELNNQHESHDLDDDPGRQRESDEFGFVHVEGFLPNAAICP